MYHDAVTEEVLRKVIQMSNISMSYNISACNISNKGKCSICNEMLEKKDLTEEERELFLEKMGAEFKNIKHLKTYVENHHYYDVIIDGANVSMYNNSPFNPKKVDAVLGIFIFPLILTQLFS